MTLIKTSLLNAIAVAARMLTLLGINKVLAIFVGPAGYGALGQFQNAMQLIGTFSSGAVSTGVTKYTAEYGEDPSKQHEVWRTAGTIVLAGSAVATIILFCFNRQLAEFFLQRPDFGSVFIWFGVALVPFTINALLLAILNGKKEIRRYVSANIAGSVFAFVATALMTNFFGLYGALVALATYQSVSVVATIALCVRAPWFRLSLLFGKVDREIASNLAKYAAMALTSAVMIPSSHITLRYILGDSFGPAAVGYWEAIWRLSSAYLLLVTTTLSVYYLPRLSELRDPAAIRRELVQGYKVIVPVAAGCSVLMYLLRDLIVALLFTKDFAPVRDLFAWQMVGDTLKIGSWILAYIMISKALTRMYIVTEIVFSANFVILALLFSKHYGVRGAVIAHAVNYALYWIVIAVLLRPQFKQSRAVSEVARA